jgi:hypothetical protein
MLSRCPGAFLFCYTRNDCPFTGHHGYLMNDLGAGRTRFGDKLSPPRRTPDFIGDSSPELFLFLLILANGHDAILSL